jgi:hypothetical protein
VIVTPQLLITIGEDAVVVEVPRGAAEVCGAFGVGVPLAGALDEPAAGWDAPAPLPVIVARVVGGAGAPPDE